MLDYEEECLSDMWVDYKIFYESSAALSDIYEQILVLLEPLCRDYIWHNQHFKLQVATNSSIPCIEGRTVFGDCMDDEWFIMFLLDKISKMPQKPVIKVCDNDGEFLLIEAAEELPRWIHNVSCENRVYWYDGALHVVPIPSTSQTFKYLPTGEPIVSEAIKIIKDRTSECRLADAAQQTIKSRIEQFPSKKVENLHKTRALVPKKIAYLLGNSPNLISSAVEAFYLRDPVSLRSCNKMENFSLEDLVETSVKMTRTLYAQLCAQKFNFPKVFQSIVADQKESTNIGMKIACGFEILLTDKLYKSHQSQVAESFRKNLDPQIRFVDYIPSLLSREIGNISDFISNEESDDASWMFIDPASLDDILKAKQTSSVGASDKIEELVDGFKSFMGKESGLDGVEIGEEGEYASDESFDSEQDEYEVLQTILNDPDLLMKMIEKNEMMGFDNSDMLAKLSAMANEMADGPEEDDEEEDDVLSSQDAELAKKLQSDLSSFKRLSKNDDILLAENLVSSMKDDARLGPASSLFKSMGINLPHFEDDDFSDEAGDEDSDFYGN